MYQQIYYDKPNNMIHLWDDTNGYSMHKYEKYGYKKDPNGTFKHIQGFNVSKTTKITKHTHESDVEPTIRFLVDNYHASNDVSKDISIIFFDIEIKKEEYGYSKTTEATNIINAISFYNNLDGKKYVLILVDEDTEIKKYKDEKKGRVLIPFKSEKKLLKAFLSYYKKVQPHILVGWNSDTFDIPYIYNRLKNLFNEKTANTLSPIGIVKESINEDYEATYKIAGVSSFDYMVLYKNFTFGEKPNYRLDTISKIELGKGKVEYDGDLDILYKRDIKKFIEYSIVDTELLIELDKKLDFISLARMQCHMTHVPYSDVTVTSKVLEGGALTFMKNNNLVAPNRKPKIKLELKYKLNQGDTTVEVKDKIDSRVPGSGRLSFKLSQSVSVTVPYRRYDGKTFYLKKPIPRTVPVDAPVKISLVGAFVKFPQTGIHKWVFDIDLTSLYPSIIRTLNISPETKVGRIMNWSVLNFRKELSGKWKKKPIVWTVKCGSKYKDYSSQELHKWLKKNKYCYAANGVIYRQDINGFIPTILGVWFDQRVEYKDLKKKYGKLGDKEKAKYYHTLQLVQKVLLNSFYGVLALPSFRFYDIDNAEAVTETGQQIIKFSAEATDKSFMQQLGFKSKKSNVIYIDTDSCFATVVPLIKKFNPDVNLDYDTVSDKRLDFEYVDFDNWGNTYNFWIKDFIKIGIKQNLLSEDATLEDKEIVSKMETIPLFKLQTFIKSKYTPETAVNEYIAIKWTIHYAKKVQSFINKSYDMYVVKYHGLLPERKHYLDIKQEFVARSAIWLAKKRYAQWIVDNEGIPVNSLDVKGLDVVRSNYPAAFRKFMSEFITEILNDLPKDKITKKIIEFKKNVHNIDLMQIMNPTGVKNISNYVGKTKGIPVHVQASLNYNDLLYRLKDTQTTKIINGDKIMWVYLQKNPYNFDVMALKGFEDNEKIVAFVKKYLDYELLINKNVIEKFNIYYEAMNWGEINLSQQTFNKFFA